MPSRRSSLSAAAVRRTSVLRSLSHSIISNAFSLSFQPWLASTPQRLIGHRADDFDQLLVVVEPHLHLNDVIGRRLLHFLAYDVRRIDPDRERRVGSFLRRESPYLIPRLTEQLSGQIVPARYRPTLSPPGCREPPNRRIREFRPFGTDRRTWPRSSDPRNLQTDSASRRGKAASTPSP